MPPEERQLLLDDRALARTLHRMAQDILRQTPDPTLLVLIGVQRRGVELAARLAGEARAQSGAEVPRGALDITLYRDDLEVVGPRPLVGPTHLPVDLDGRHAWIVDDVLFTGRTVRAALDELVDFGRPARIGLAVLVDRGGRELPIQADVVGETVPTGSHDRVEVFVKELDGRDAVEVVRGAKVGV
ncbi:MAG: bifunctional pyr operon transcriptional regulator/uracil phosphoribosyltransferase PyrR [Gemmatimonadetes bacterium]|nr:bifunctional pyr operon transcriptional regulator/uracil phosphoribosyltransferase PyrR [Gemmatimonadota bacterium]